ncbi:hypothetical protein [Alicyclobacillus sp. ALC3]|uniref:hypothetical protein n=1 Tax=Alicyclobacillus sp. ALC3 TaxID=2796143 RepID=UPI002378CE59|nr:hypothetical protein [Alicyclobacillus sp. ALC3]WDL99767.1 hypothetical protein JC200_23630 [Alicyclobacillus sp. ALC3]
MQKQYEDEINNFLKEFYGATDEEVSIPTETEEEYKVNHPGWAERLQNEDK